MRVLVFSDVHANVVALDTVLRAAGPVDAYWFLGDAVGYGPDPNAVLDRLRALPRCHCLLGNHDAAIVGRLPLGWFNLDAQRVLMWTRNVLHEDNLAFLRRLEPIHTQGKTVLAHASPRDPLEEYVLSEESARANLQALAYRYGFIGHSHIPLAWVPRLDGLGADLMRPQDADYGRPFALPEVAVLLNPGSVGQPRDGDPRAAYAIYDDEANTWTWHRVPYDLDAARARFAQVPAIPPRFSKRLLEGR